MLHLHIIKNTQVNRDYQQRSASSLSANKHYNTLHFKKQCVFYILLQKLPIQNKRIIVFTKYTCKFYTVGDFIRCY